VRVSLDDFGTGYSSLSYLNRVPLDVLKIDHCFVRDIHVDPGAKGVVSAVISMAHSLGLEVVAEGADCEEQVEVLVKIGCDAVQGFVFSPAIPEREFAELLVSSARSSPAAETPDAAGAQDAREAADPLLPAVRADDAALRAAPIEIETAPPRVQVTADPPAEVRLLVVDDGTAGLGVLAMRLNRMGATAIYAGNEDEGLLFTSEQGAAIRALAVHSDSDVASIHRLVGRIAATSGGAPTILFVGDDVAKPLLDLRSRSRIWSLREPILDAPLWSVTRSALYGTPPEAMQRQHPRVDLDLIASVAAGDQTEAALLSSLSLRGAFLELAKRPPVGADVDVAFQVEDVAIRARAKVLYHSGPSGDSPEGIGVGFEAHSAANRETIETLIDQRSVRCLG